MELDWSEVESLHSDDQFEVCMKKNFERGLRSWLLECGLVVTEQNNLLSPELSKQEVHYVVTCSTRVAVFFSFHHIKMNTN